MAPKINFESFSDSASAFNEKYGVSFNIRTFNLVNRNLNSDYLGNSVTQEKFNDYYRDSFMVLFNKAFGNYVDYKIQSFDAVQMFSDFEDMVMGPYRKECERLGMVAPSYGGRNEGKEILGKMQEALNGVPDSKYEYQAKKYESGELRLRDIRAYVKKAGDTPTSEQLGTMISYYSAIERATANRTRGWIFRHPFKALAEWRYLDKLKGHIYRKTGVDPDNTTYTVAYDNAETYANSGRIVDVKDAFANKLEEIAPEMTAIDTQRNLSETERQEQRVHSEVVQRNVYGYSASEGSEQLYNDPATEEDVYAVSDGRVAIDLNSEFSEEVSEAQMSERIEDKEIEAPKKGAEII